MLESRLFQSTLRRTERLFFAHNKKCFTYFNPRSDERSDNGRMARYFIRVNFNPRSDERSDGRVWQSQELFVYFNPRSDERSDSIFISPLWVRLWFQSTLRRTERLRKTLDLAGQPLISIHAPTNGATFLLLHYVQPVLDFNPRSDERSDSWHKIIVLLHTLFQSTLRRTERQIPFCNPW